MPGGARRPRENKHDSRTEHELLFSGGASGIAKRGPVKDARELQAEAAAGWGY